MPVDQEQIEEVTVLKADDPLVNSANSLQNGEVSTAKAANVTNNATQHNRKETYFQKKPTRDSENKKEVI